MMIIYYLIISSYISFYTILIGYSKKQMTRCRHLFKRIAGTGEWKFPNSAKNLIKSVNYFSISISKLNIIIFHENVFLHQACPNFRTGFETEFYCKEYYGGKRHAKSPTKLYLSPQIMVLVIPTLYGLGYLVFIVISATNTFPFHIKMSTCPKPKIVGSFRCL